MNLSIKASSRKYLGRNVIQNKTYDIPRNVLVNNHSPPQPGCLIEMQNKEISSFSIWMWRVYTVPLTSQFENDKKDDNQPTKAVQRRFLSIWLVGLPFIFEIAICVCAAIPLKFQSSCKTTPPPNLFMLRNFPWYYCLVSLDTIVLLLWFFWKLPIK